MTAPALPLLPTTVVASYAIPSWLWAALEKIEAGAFGTMDVAETEDDAVEMAVRGRPLFPAIHDVHADQLVFEFANREMSEIGLWKEFACPKELCGLARLPRYLGFAKLRRLLAGARLVREELAR